MQNLVLQSLSKGYISTREVNQSGQHERKYPAILNSYFNPISRSDQFISQITILTDENFGHYGSYQKIFKTFVFAQTNLGDKEEFTKIENQLCIKVGLQYSN